MIPVVDAKALVGSPLIRSVAEPEKVTPGEESKLVADHAGRPELGREPSIPPSERSIHESTPPPYARIGPSPASHHRIRSGSPSMVPVGYGFEKSRSRTPAGVMGPSFGEASIVATM